MVRHRPTCPKEELSEIKRAKADGHTELYMEGQRWRHLVEAETARRRRRETSRLGGSRPERANQPRNLDQCRAAPIERARLPDRSLFWRLELPHALPWPNAIAPHPPAASQIPQPD